MGNEEARYMSTGGSLNPQQPVLLRGVMEKMPDESLFILGGDCDRTGDKLAGEVGALAPVGHQLLQMVPETRTGKDRNDILRYRLRLT